MTKDETKQLEELWKRLRAAKRAIREWSDELQAVELRIRALVKSNTK